MPKIHQHNHHHQIMSKNFASNTVHTVLYTMTASRSSYLLVAVAALKGLTHQTGTLAFAPRLGIAQTTQRRTQQLNASVQKQGRDETNQDDEWHPHDAASTTPQLLSGIWFMISQGNSMVKGESSTVMFPQMESFFHNPSYLNRLMGHLDSCKDVCDNFGINTIIVPYTVMGRVAGFTVKSFRNPEKDGENLDFQFEYDPFWDDGDDWSHEGVDDEVEDTSTQSKYPEIVNKIPDDDDKIIDTTKIWVDKMMSDMGICPFTSGPNLAGLPMGQVFYAVDRCNSMEDMYARYWKEVVRLEQNPEKDLSTTLLITPEFCMDNIELFESFSNTLTQPLTALGIEDLLQLVFFHPYWTFRDGGDRSGDGMAANYARRSPWPMINLLRTSQVRAAQRGIPTGLVYQQNEKTLANIGVDKLETMLRLRDWTDVANVKVNRREMEALKIAQDYQQTGTIDSKDLTFENDSTPAANKVDSKKIEQGNLINVIKQALEKRLGKSGGAVTPLSGPETSATVMASDFLLQELDRISIAPAVPTAAHRALMDDVMGLDDDDDDDDDAETSVLWGGGGIMGRKDDEDEDEGFSTGMNPRTFY